MKKLFIVPAILILILFAGCKLRKPNVTMVERFSPQCGHCMREKPILDALEKKYASKLKIIRCDITTPGGNELAAEYNMRGGGVPSMAFLDKHGKKFSEHTGFMRADELENIIIPYMGFFAGLKGIMGILTIVFLGFFAIMNPLGNVPVFMALTSGYSKARAKKTAKNSIVIAFVVTALFIIFGALIFKFFGITLPSFKAAGGVLIALIGYKLLHGKMSEVHHPEGMYKKKSSEDIVVSPLAIPILAGPGTVTAAMNFASVYRGILNVFMIILVLAVICFITYICFIYGKKISTRLGGGIMKVITQIMGLIITVMGAQMLLEGVASALHIR